MAAGGQPLPEEQGVEAGELERAEAPLPLGNHHARGQRHDAGGNAKGERGVTTRQKGQSQSSIWVRNFAINVEKNIASGLTDDPLYATSHLNNRSGIQSCKVGHVMSSYEVEMPGTFSMVDTRNCASSPLSISDLLYLC